MNGLVQRFAVLLAFAALAACYGNHTKDAQPPSGQVVAIVDGHEITVRNLDAELAGLTIDDPSARKVAEQAALRAIISRTILANAAREQGLEKTPEFAIQRQKMTETLLVQALESKIAATVPLAVPEDAESFMAAHPDSFAQRKIFTVDQILATQAADPALLAALKPLNSLEEAAALLSRDHITYHRSTTDLDALTLDPKVSDSIAKLPPSEIFVIPTADSVQISQIKQTRVEPFTGQPAVAFALRLIQARRRGDVVSREIDAILAKGASFVRYNPRYAPRDPNAPVSNVRPS